jgi:hypothetical protein
MQCRTEDIYNFIYKENNHENKNKMYVQKGLPVYIDRQEIIDRRVVNENGTMIVTDIHLYWPV